MDAICASHPAALGWILGIPKISSIDDVDAAEI